jgi:rhodanese-related sulfurtransferase
VQPRPSIATERAFRSPNPPGGTDLAAAPWAGSALASGVRSRSGLPVRNGGPWWAGAALGLLMMAAPGPATAQDTSRSLTGQGNPVGSATVAVLHGSEEEQPASVTPSDPSAGGSEGEFRVSGYPKWQSRYGVSGMVVDLRDRESFLDGHLPGSLNLPLRELRVRRALRARPILLVDQGHAPRRLREICQDFRDLGFTSVEYLAGGVRACVATGVPLEGRRAGQSGVWALPPGEALEMLADPTWSVLWLGDSLPSLPAELRDRVVVAPAAGDGLASAWAHLVTGRPPPSGVLLLGPGAARWVDGSAAPPIVAEGPNPVPWFPVTGGWDAMERLRILSSGSTTGGPRRVSLTSGDRDDPSSLRAVAKPVTSSCCGGR